VSKNWFKNAQPKALKDTLRTIEWMPELAAPARENHLVRTAGVVKRIYYEKGKISYDTFPVPGKRKTFCASPSNPPRLPPTATR